MSNQGTANLATGVFSSTGRDWVLMWSLRCVAGRDRRRTAQITIFCERKVVDLVNACQIKAQQTSRRVILSQRDVIGFSAVKALWLSWLFFFMHTSAQINQDKQKRW